MEKYGRYEVKRVIGRGGMGTVYLAEDPIIGREVAVKVILMEPGATAAEQEERKIRFEREFRLAGTLSHGSIVTVYDVGVESEHAYIAMEYVPGDSLEDIMRREERLPLDRIADIALQIGSALDLAHQHEIVHRDVKPANILLTSDGRAKITDFGVAKLANTNLTRTGSAVGTPRYMSPEVLDAQGVGGRSDQFSLAVILFELLTGEPQHPGDTISKILYQIAYEPPRLPRSVRPGVGEAVDAVFERALDKDPESRFPSCVAMAEALRVALGEGETATSRAATRSGTVNLADGPTTTPLASDVQRGEEASGIDAVELPHERTVERHEKPRRWLLPASIVVGLALAGGGIAIWQAVLFEGGETARPGRQTPPPDSNEHAAPHNVNTALEIVSSPAGASILVNGIDEAQVTPARVALEGTPGDVVLVELVYAGEKVAETRIELGTDMPSGWEPSFALPVEPYLVTSSPAGARVFLDGEELAERTPTTIELDAVSSYELRLELDGYELRGWSFTLDDLSVDQRSDGKLEFPLVKKALSSVLLADFPFAARIEVNGRRYETTGRREIPLGPGAHDIVVVAPEVFYRKRQSVKSVGGDRIELPVPAIAEVVVGATPSNCTVQIDGRDMGFVPVYVNLAVGKHTFEFNWPGLGESTTAEELIEPETGRVFRAAPSERGE